MGHVHRTEALDNIERLSSKTAEEKSPGKDHTFFLCQSMLKTLNYIYCHCMIIMNKL